MTKLVLLFIAASAAAAPALADTPLNFERNGITYVGTMSERDGVRHIVGHEVASGRNFDLLVIKGRVTGSYDGAQVSYIAPKANPAVLASN